MDGEGKLYVLAFPRADAPVEQFEPSLWCALPDLVTAYSKKDVQFTFKDGMEIRT